MATVVDGLKYIIYKMKLSKNWEGERDGEEGSSSALMNVGDDKLYGNLRRLVLTCGLYSFSCPSSCSLNTQEQDTSSMEIFHTLLNTCGAASRAISIEHPPPALPPASSQGAIAIPRIQKVRILFASRLFLLTSLHTCFFPTRLSRCSCGSVHAGCVCVS